MRKIVLAAAIATSALGLAACGETAEQAGETVDAMAADAEANAEAAGDAVEGAAERGREGVEHVPGQDVGRGRSRQRKTWAELGSGCCAAPGRTEPQDRRRLGP